MLKNIGDYLTLQEYNKVIDLSAAGYNQSEIRHKINKDRKESEALTTKQLFVTCTDALEAYKEGRRKGRADAKKRIVDLMNDPQSLTSLKACEVYLDRFHVTMPSNGARPVVRANTMCELVDEGEVSIKMGKDYLDMLESLVKVTQVEEFKRIMMEILSGLSNAKDIGAVQQIGQIFQKQLEKM